jgi:hypothetical protein
MYWVKAEKASVNEHALYIVAFGQRHGSTKDKMLMAGKTILACLQSKSEQWRPKWMARVVDPETNGC